MATDVTDVADDGERIDIRVIPRARRDSVGGERAGRLVVRTTAAPVDGGANDAVRVLLAAHFGVRPGQVEIVSGHRHRDKSIRIADRNAPGR
ncbi:MAG: DUF167 domain-containing protein [Desertimonas sp.]